MNFLPQTTPKHASTSAALHSDMFAVPLETHSELILQARKIELESCK